MKKILSSLIIFCTFLTSIFSYNFIEDVFQSNDYAHVVNFGASYIPYPYQGWGLDLDYNYMIGRFGIGPGLSYSSWYVPYTEKGGYSNFSYTTTYGAFSLTAPIRFYPFPIDDDDGFIMDICVEPQWNFIHIDDYHKGIDQSDMSFGAEIRCEAGASIVGLYFRGFVGWNFDTFHKANVVLGLNCGFSLEKY